MNEETILCSRKKVDAASGSAAPVLRYFCSQTHCEEGKRDHEVTLKEYNSELARIEGELKRMQDDFDIDSGHYKERTVVWEQKNDELTEELKLERESYKLKLREVQTEVLFKDKKTWKVFGEIQMRKAANLERFVRRKELEIGREVVGISLLQFREHESMGRRRVGIFDDEENFHREKYARDVTALEQHLLRIREDKEIYVKIVLETPETIRTLEDQLMLISKELDAINAELDSNEKGSTTAATSAADPGPVKTPAEQPEHLKATSSKKGTKEERSGKVDAATELARKESELKRKEEELNADLEIITKQGVEWQQKHDGLNEDLERERQNHELKLRELKSDVYTSKRPLKEMGEFVKRESANLQRIFRKKELEVEQEASTISLLKWRRTEAVFVRKIGIVKEGDDFVRDKYAGEETELQQHLVRLREDKEIYQKGLLQTGGKVRIFEERQILISKELDAINAKLNSTDKDTATATTSAGLSLPKSSATGCATPASTGTGGAVGNTLLF